MVKFIAEVSSNHNNDLERSLLFIEEAAKSKCDAVKFQKRTPELCVPLDQRNVMRETPWGQMTYMDYRYKVEFDEKQYLLPSLKPDPIHQFRA